jgi:hypothetical protein
MSTTAVIPTGAERSEAEWRDLFISFWHTKRSLDFASLGMTGKWSNANALCLQGEVSW